MAVCLFSLAGIPPLVGFYAKLAVLQALVASGRPLYIGLAVFAVMMSLVGAFYYLRVVKVMYFDAPITATTVSAPADVRRAVAQRRAGAGAGHRARRPDDPVRAGHRHRPCVSSLMGARAKGGLRRPDGPDVACRSGW
jgi:NADH:ubiquinone oxidoreductase subunit 5 (subunit L)/multisubunit Na+/H+ antiporter MnhA subunit